MAEECCVYEDPAEDLPAISLPAVGRSRVHSGIPEKRWCWTHGRWERTETDG